MANLRTAGNGGLVLRQGEGTSEILLCICLPDYILDQYQCTEYGIITEQQTQNRLAQGG